MLLIIIIVCSANPNGNESYQRFVEQVILLEIELSPSRILNFKQYYTTLFHRKLLFRLLIRLKNSGCENPEHVITFHKF